MSPASTVTDGVMPIVSSSFSERRSTNTVSRPSEGCAACDIACGLTAVFPARFFRTELEGVLLEVDEQTDLLILVPQLQVKHETRALPVVVVFVVDIDELDPWLVEPHVLGDLRGERRDHLLGRAVT